MARLRRAGFLPRLALALGTAVATLSMAWDAGAAVAVHLTAGARVAEPGDRIEIEVSAMSDGDDSPKNPRLTAPPGVTLEGPSISSSQQISFTNGQFERRRGINATWVVTASKPGHYVIGPAVVDAGQRAMRSETVEIDIVPTGQNPHRRGVRQNNPFDPFSLFPQMPKLPGFDEPDLAPLLAPPEAPPEFSLDHAADPTAFLRATVTPSRAVVGQEIRLRVYAYGGRGAFDETNSSEPSHTDFLSESFIDSSYRQPRYLVDIDGARYNAVKVREVALFPLHSGTLTIGSMRVGFHGPGYPETAPLQGLVRTTPELTVRVTEPPIAGRPPGYALGDVGHFTLSAEVEPRTVTAGDAVAVTARIEGSGNFPHEVKVPSRNGVEWLPPTTSEAIAPNGAAVAGYRQFQYVVRVDDPTIKDLGEVTLPYYDPTANRYEVARAPLGKVEITPNPSAATPKSAAPGASAAPPDPLEGLGGSRKRLGFVAPSARRLTESNDFFASLLLGPLAVLIARGGVGLARAVTRRREVRSRSTSTLVRKALGDARGALARGDRAAFASAVERALYASVEAGLGLKARAVLFDDLERALEAHGADGELAKDVVAVLGESEKLRFGDDSHGVSTELVARAQSIANRLERIAPRRTEAS